MPPSRPQTQFSLEQAVVASPNLSQLRERIRQSERCLALVRPFIPVHLHPHVRAGPLDEDRWCLLVSSTAASTKLRQLSPVLLNILGDQGLGIQHIRIKVQRPGA